MRVDAITLFPGMFSGPLDESIIRRSRDAGILDLRVHNLRDYTRDRHKTVDDRPFGGGSGMVMCPEPIFRAVEALGKDAKVILLSPKGEKLTQKTAKKLAKYKHLILICGHYEGIDERVRERLVDQEISIGDYVLTGGELPAMVLIDCLVRLIPGVLGDKASLAFESFEDNLLEYPHYTRPADFRGRGVPEILLSGNHKKIEAWRRQQALKITRKKRPDLIQKVLHLPIR